MAKGWSFDSIIFVCLLTATACLFILCPPFSTSNHIDIPSSNGADPSEWLFDKSLVLNAPATPTPQAPNYFNQSSSGENIISLASILDRCESGDKFLIVMPRYSIESRMKVLVSSRLAAMKSRRTLVVLWTHSPSTRVPFSRLFNEEASGFYELPLSSLEDAVDESAKETCQSTAYAARDQIEDSSDSSTEDMSNFKQRETMMNEFASCLMKGVFDAQSKVTFNEFQSPLHIGMIRRSPEQILFTVSSHSIFSLKKPEWSILDSRTERRRGLDEEYAPNVFESEYSSGLKAFVVNPMLVKLVPHLKEKTVCFHFAGKSGSSFTDDEVEARLQDVGKQLDVDSHPVLLSSSSPMILSGLMSAIQGTHVEHLETLIMSRVEEVRKEYSLLLDDSLKGVLELLSFAQCGVIVSDRKNGWSAQMSLYNLIPYVYVEF